MRLGEAHHCESHHGERINSVPAEALHPAEHRGSRAQQDFDSEELGNFSAGLVCLTVGTLMANGSIIRSQHGRCKSRISFNRHKSRQQNVISGAK